MNSFDLFQIAYINKLPKSIITIIREYYNYKKFLISYNDHAGMIQNQFITAKDRNQCIQKFVMNKTLRELVSRKFLFALECYWARIKTSDPIIFVPEQILEEILMTEIHQYSEFIKQHFDGIVEIVDKYDNGRYFSITTIE
jgi:hypothetical protein